MLLLHLLVFYGAMASGVPEPVRSARSELIEQYCIACHSDRVRAAGLSLAGIETHDVSRNAETWEKVLLKVGTRQMPPAGSRRPDGPTLTAFTSELATALDRASALQPNPGRVGVHRLNRVEYANAIRDLLAIQVDTDSLLLPDEAEGGFDNVAASLTLSPAHMERYLSTARRISRLAVGDPTIGNAPALVMYGTPRLLAQDQRLSEDQPFGSRGGVTVQHHFPLDGEYVIKVRLRRQIYDYIIGMSEPQQLDIRIDGKRIKRLTVGGEGKGTPGPLTWVGETVGDTEWELYMHDADAGLEVRILVQAGTRRVSVSFVHEPREPEGIRQPLPTDFGRGADEQYDGYAAVDRLSIGGPYSSKGSSDTASRRAVFVCRPGDRLPEDTCARTIVSTLAQRAYRRPVTRDDVDTLFAFYREAHRAGGFEAGIQAAIERLLVSPNFLFRVENNPQKADQTSYRLSDVELASRLSFFLWSSIPDRSLLEAAIQGKLKDPAVLDQQVRRMLADPRSKALVNNFAAQWLTVRKARTWQPDTNVFPEFDENLRESFLKETELFVEDQFRADRSVTDLLTADYTFLNERLGRHYGLPGVYGERFRRVTLKDGVRGGLLGQGSILMITSYPDRTSPVVRGKWLLDNILGMPPPPPLPDVPELDPRGEDGRILSVREQLQKHRANPVCASCHATMDPLGFTLENFGAIGQWRDTAAGGPIDASAVLADDTRFEGVGGLRSYLADHRDDFIRTFTTKLLTYALGRRVEYYDQPAVRRILRETAGSNHRWSSIILGIVKSIPFQMRRAS